MSYIKRDDVPCQAEEQVVQLDTGELVATSCRCERVAMGLSFHALARAIDETGEAVPDAVGRPVRTEFKHVVPVSLVEQESANAIARDCLLAVLGEPVTRPWADVLLAGVSIRVSLAAAPMTGPVDVSGVL